MAKLLVTIYISASHIAYSSTRMESLYMLIGEPAGIAAALALRTYRSVHDVDRDALTA